MKILYGMLAVVSVAVIAFGVWMQLTNEEGSVTDFNSPSMRFNRAKGTAEVLYQRAQQNGDYQSVITAYKQALAIRPENAEVENDLAAVYYEMGKQMMAPPVEENLRDYSPIPSDTVDYMKQKFSVIPSGKFVWDISAAALDPVKAYLDSLPNVLYELEPIGMDYQVTIITGKTAEAFRNAEVHYWKAINAKPDYAPAFRNLGALYIMRGRRKDAIEILEEALKLEPQDRELATYLQQLKGY